MDSIEINITAEGSGVSNQIFTFQERIVKDITKQPKRVKPLPSAGPKKRNPKDREKILDKGLEDSMATSDPVSTVMPEVKKDQDAESTQP